MHKVSRILKEHCVKLCLSRSAATEISVHVSLLAAVAALPGMRVCTGDGQQLNDVCRIYTPPRSSFFLWLLPFQSASFHFLAVLPAPAPLSETSS